MKKRNFNTDDKTVKNSQILKILIFQGYRCRSMHVQYLVHIQQFTISLLLSSCGACGKLPSMKEGKKLQGITARCNSANSQLQLLFTLIVYGRTAKTMDVITKYKLQKFVAERCDRNTGKFKFPQHITFQKKFSSQINYVTLLMNRWIISLHL